MTEADLTQVRRQLADRYAIEQELGRGGMGAVYLARDLRLDRLVALKVLPVEFAADAALRERFLRETRTAASFSHPNIVPVHAVEERDGVVAYAMGYVEGESLAQRVQRSGPLGIRELVRLLQDIGYALAYAHGRGIVHRDIKPDNIMIERATGRSLLMDFGISRTITSSVAAAGLTRVGEVVGTPEYMSPEQASGDVVDGRSDLYSLGLVAWFAATGRTAMTGETTQKVLVKQLTEQVPLVESVRPELPDALSAAIDRCIAKAPEERFATAEALVEAVDNSQLAGPEIPLPVRVFAQELGTLSLVLAFVLAGSWLMSRVLSSRLTSIDALLPVVILYAVALTRILQTLAEGRRLAEAGFSRDEILTGLRAVVDERESLRVVLRTDATTRRRRRATLIAAVVQLTVATLLIVGSLRTRTRLSPTQFSTPPMGVAMVITAMMLFGVSVVLILRSPFRMPPGERLFRRIWLGAVGRAFLAFASRGVAPRVGMQLSGLATAGRGAASVSRSQQSAAPVPAPPPKPVLPVVVAPTPNGVPRADATGATDDTALARLEARVQALEVWRRERG